MNININDSSSWVYKRNSKKIKTRKPILNKKAFLGRSNEGHIVMEIFFFTEILVSNY